jgi:hypothetical protein
VNIFKSIFLQEEEYDCYCRECGTKIKNIDSKHCNINYQCSAVFDRIPSNLLKNLKWIRRGQYLSTAFFSVFFFATFSGSVFNATLINSDNGNFFISWKMAGISFLLGVVVVIILKLIAWLTIHRKCSSGRDCESFNIILKDKNKKVSLVGTGLLNH